MGKVVKVTCSQDYPKVTVHVFCKFLMRLDLYLILLNACSTMTWTHLLWGVIVLAW